MIDRHCYISVSASTPQAACEPEEPDIFTDLLRLCQIWWHGQCPAPTFVCLIAICHDDRHTLIKDMSALGLLPIVCMKCEVVGFFWLFFPFLLHATLVKARAPHLPRLCQS